MPEVISLIVSTSTVTQILLLGFMGFALAMALTPMYTAVAYKYKWWKQYHPNAQGGGKETAVAKLQAAKHKRNIPTMAGMIFIVATLIVTGVANLDRSQTWLPLAGLVGAGAVGLIDGWLSIRGNGKGIAAKRARLKFFLHSIVAFLGGWWFYAKLDVTSLNLGFAEVSFGALVILIFWFVVIATSHAVSITDGLDGLAGGLLVSSFGVYTVIAAFQGQYALAGFCLTIVGGLLSYTWFNIYPARFFMGDVGSFALGTALAIIALQTDTLYVLPVIGLVYVAEAGSVIIDRISRRLRGGKQGIILSPVHLHFEAIGWPETKVTMRFWVVGQVSAAMGLILFFFGSM